MKKLIISLFVGAMCLSSCNTDKQEESAPESLTQYVNPLIGTAHCRWFHFTPGALPFGMAKPAAATNASVGNKSGWEATGYDYRDTPLRVFLACMNFRWAVSY